MFRLLAAHLRLYLVGYISLSLFLSIVLVMLGQYDQWLLILSWPIILGAVLFPRRIYLILLAVGVPTALITLRYVSADIGISLWTLLISSLTTSITSESLFRLMRRQRATATALQASEARFRHLFDRAPVPMAITDLEGRLKRFNPALCAMLGYDADELDNLALNAIATLEDQVPGRRLRDAIASADGADVEIEKRYVRKDGTQVETLVKGTLLHNAKGQPSELLGVLIDLTARHRAEEQRLTFERNILQTQRFESLGILASGIAHDFNNLLAGVLGNAGLALLDIPAESPARASLEQIEIAVRRATVLTQQMLAYAGHGQMMREPCDMNTGITEISLMLRASIPASIEIHYRLADEPLMVYVDHAQLRQLLTAVMVNAAEAIGDGVGHITVSTALQHLDDSSELSFAAGAEPSPGDYAVAEIRDSGCGIDPAISERIFDPFFSTKASGRGLGLAAASGIVRGHSGALRVESSPGQGAVFQIWLPLIARPNQLEARSDAPIRSPEPTEPSHAPYTPPRTILVVDDEQAIRTVTTRMVRRLGYETLEAPDGQAGVDLFATHADKIACVLLDVTMPIMSGAQALVAMRRIQPAIPIILMSGYASDDTAVRFAQLQPTGYLQKPFDAAELHACLNAI